MPQGGARVGAGRTPLAPSRKKKDYKIYLNTDVYEDINTYGKGNSFSTKVVDLVTAEIDNRKPHNYHYRFIDLFAGVGGFHLAFEKYGNKCVFASEIEPHCQKVYEKIMVCCQLEISRKLVQMRYRILIFYVQDFRVSLLAMREN